MPPPAKSRTKEVQAAPADPLPVTAAERPDKELSAETSARLRNAKIVALEGEISDLTETEITVTTGVQQSGGANHATFKVLRFKVSGASVVLYAAQRGVNNFGFTPAPMLLSNGDHVRLAVASEAFSGEQFVYGLLDLRSKQVYVSFALRNIESQRGIDFQAIDCLPRLPRVWKSSRWREGAKVIAFAAMAIGIWTYIGLNDPRGGGETTIELDGFVVLACAIYFGIAANAAIRWHYGWFTQRQRNLAAVFDAMGVIARGRDRVSVLQI
jgi:hypothetical protein